MAKAQILIVEDDAIIAMDLESRLKSFGYSVPGIVSYGDDAIKKVEECRPDLVFMDIVLKGDMDGIEAADQIRTQFDIPVVFVTAHMDEDRLERAKLTLPFGYILKPFQDRELKATIEMVLYTSKVDAEPKQAEEALRQAHDELEQPVEERTAELVKANEQLKKEIDERKRIEKELQLHREIIENMAEGVYLIRTSDGVIVYTNPNFERIFGYDSRELIGKHVSIVNAPMEKTPEETAEEIIQRLNEKGAWSGEVKNIKKDGTQFWCHANVSTFDHHEFGEVWISVHEDITKRKQIEE